MIALLFHRSAFSDTPIGFWILGTVQIDQRVRLRTRWVPGNNLVEFQKDGETPVTIPYSNIPVGLPDVNENFLEALTLVNDCPDTSLSSADVVALFDNVQIAGPSVKTPSLAASARTP